MKDLTREFVLEDLRTAKPILQCKYGVKRIGLYGSFSRGCYRSDSDVDVVVELAEPDLFALIHIKEELEADFQRPVDVIPLSEYTNEALKLRIQNEAIYV